MKYLFSLITINKKKQKTRGDKNKMDAEETLQVLTRMLEICCSKASAKDVAEYNVAFENAVKAIVYYASHNDI